MRESIVSYITAMANMMERQNDMVSTAVVADHLNDLLDFVMDIPDDRVIEISYDDSGSDGMNEWYDRMTNNLN